MSEQKKDIWAVICGRTDIERGQSEEGYPSTVPQTYSCEWFNFKREVVTFQVGEPSPFMSTHKVIAIFEDTFEWRVYTYPDSKGQQPQDNLPVRWTVQKTAPTKSLTLFLKLEVYFDALASELLVYMEEFEELFEPDQNGQPAAPEPQVAPPPGE